jgi:tetratricopeptide (TPR) repeat protein
MTRLLARLRATFAVHQRSPTAREQWEIALNHLEHGSWGCAVEAFQQFIRLDPYFAGGHYNLGQACFQLERYEAAREAYLMAVRCDPKYAEAQAMLGMACTHLHRYEQAIQASQRARELRPDLPQAYNTLGLAYMGLERWQNALEAFEQHLAIAPSDPRCYFNVASVHLHLGQHSKAIELIEACLRRVPPDVGADSMLVGGLLASPHAAAVEDWSLRWLGGDQAPLSLDPAALGRFLQSLASRCAEPGELSTSQRQTLQRGLQIVERFSPGDFHSEPLKAAERELLRKLGRLPDNDLANVPVCDREGDRLFAMVVEMNMHRVHGHTSQAEAAAREILVLWRLIARSVSDPNEVNPRWVSALVDSGICFREIGAVDAAEETLRRALLELQRSGCAESEEPETLNAIATCHNQLGILYLDTGRLAQAEEAFRQALTVREMMARMYVSDWDNDTYLGGAMCNLGHVHAGRWQFPDAFVFYDRSIRTLKGVLRTQRHHAQAEAFLANARDAEADMRGRAKAIRKSCRRQRSYGWLPGRGVKEISRPEFAVTTLLGWRPARQRPQRIDYGVPWPTEIADSRNLFQAGRYQEVLESLDRFVERHPEYVSGWFWKARVLGALERFQAGLESLAEALKRQPDYTPAQCEKSDLLRFLGRDREALTEIESVLERNPEYAHAWYMKGLILASYCYEGGKGETFDAARNDRAIAAYDQAILLEPDHFEARLHKGITLSVSSQCSYCLIQLLMQLATESLGEEVAADYLTPHLNAFRGYLARARESFDTAIQLRPSDGALWYQKGRLLAGLDGFEEETMDAFSQATQLTPDLADAWYESARLLSQRGDREEARVCLDNALAADPALRDSAREDFPWFTEQSN